jgi:hypothetical protein
MLMLTRLQIIHFLYQSQSSAGCRIDKPVAQWTTRAGLLVEMLNKLVIGCSEWRFWCPFLADDGLWMIHHFDPEGSITSFRMCVLPGNHDSINLCRNNYEKWYTWQLPLRSEVMDHPKAGDGVLLRRKSNGMDPINLLARGDSTIMY